MNPADWTPTGDGWITLSKMKPKETKAQEPLKNAQGQLRLTRKREGIAPMPNPKPPGTKPAKFDHPLVTSGRSLLSEQVENARALAELMRLEAEAARRRRVMNEAEEEVREVRDSRGNIVARAVYGPQPLRPDLLLVAEELVRATGIEWTTARRMVTDLNARPSVTLPMAMELSRITRMGTERAHELITAFARRIHPEAGGETREGSSAATPEELVITQQPRPPRLMWDTSAETPTGPSPSPSSPFTEIFEGATPSQSSPFFEGAGASGTTRRWWEPETATSEHPGFPLIAWRDAVAFGETRAGYEVWVNARLREQVGPSDEDEEQVPVSRRAFQTCRNCPDPLSCIRAHECLPF